jgi:hypothetical protein
MQIKKLLAKCIFGLSRKFFYKTGLRCMDIPASVFD